MPELVQTLDHVCDLLTRLPGVVISQKSLEIDRARIEIMVSKPSAIEPIQQMVLGANVRLDPWVELPAPTRFRGTLIAATSARESIQFGELQLLGIHAVWHLHGAGILDASYANTLLYNWHGAPVGA